MGLKFKDYLLKDCLEIIIDYRGKTPKKLGGVWAEEGHYRAISAKNIKNNKLVNSDLIKTVDKDIYLKWMKEEIQKEDILLTSEAPLGETVFWDSDEKIVLSQRVFGLRTKKDILYPKYLWAFMQSRFFKHEITSRESGTTVTGIRRSELEKVKIKLPEYKIQKFIGDLFYNVTTKIKTNEEIQASIDRTSQLLFKHWFIDFEFLNEHGQPYKSSGGEMVESELGEIPKGWSVYRLDEFVESISNSIKKKEQPFARFLNTSDILNGEVMYKELAEVKSMPGQAKKLIQKDDILYSEIRPKNKRHAYINFDAGEYVVSTKLMVLRVNKEIYSSKTLYQWLASDEAINEFQQLAEDRSGTFPQITFSTISHYKFAVPPAGVKKHLFEPLELMVDQRLNLIDENKKLEELRNTLLPKLLSGEIEIPDDLEVE